MRLLCFLYDLQGILDLGLSLNSEAELASWSESGTLLLNNFFALFFSLILFFYYYKMISVMGLLRTDSIKSMILSSSSLEMQEIAMISKKGLIARKS